MPTFRQPEWQQQADRHTQIVDPVLTVRQLSRFEFSLKSYVRIDHALVFSIAKGGYEAYLPPRRPTRGDIAANHYTAVYEVDMGVHPHTCDLTLPSDNDAFEFTAVVDLSWQVLDPARFVASGHRDVPGLLLGELQQAARPVTRRFAIADSAAAEVELLERMNLLGPLGALAGLQVTWTLRLRRDQANIEHELRKQAIDHSAAEQIRAAQRGMEIDVEVDRRGRQSDSLQIERALQYGTQQQELLLQQQRWQHAQALLAGQHQLELQQLEAQKIDFYQYHLQQGGVHAWALHLAQHPEDSALVMTSMREDQLRMIQSQMELVKQLLSGDAAENWELEGPKQLALRTVNDILTQRLPGVPQNPPPLPQGGGPAYPGAAIPQGGGAPEPGTAGQPGPTGYGGTGGPAQPAGGYAAPTGPYAPGQPATAGPFPTGPYPGSPTTAPGPYGGPTAPGPAGTPTMPTAPGPAATPTIPTAPGPAGTPTVPAAPTAPPAPPGVAPFPQFPPGTPGAQAPAPYSPPPPAYSPPPAPGASGPYAGAPAPQAATAASPSGPAGSAPEPPAWQPPPGYGRTPTLPAQAVPDAPAAPDGNDGGANGGDRNDSGANGSSGADKTEDGGT
ncbi:hypothetical protein [Streptomyces sp. NPDC001315]|uniref:hypothetical protein n=1 Tax=Streptomyces sp. NPDC001315 TaxID=3364562 RepID=UPI00369B1F72